MKPRRLSVPRRAEGKRSPKTPQVLVTLLRKLSGFGFGTGGGTRVIRKPIKEDDQL